MDGTAWSDFLFDGLDDWFQVAVEAGAYAVLLAGVVLLINLVFRRWLSAGQMGLLWALVLARLLMPVAPASPLGLANIFAENSGADSAPMSLQADANSSTLDLNRVPAYHNESNVSNLEARTRARGTPPR